MKKLLFIILLLILLSFNNCWADIAVDATSSHSVSSSNTTISWSHTCTGDNLVLVVGVSLNESGTQPGITSATYNSVSLILIDSQSDSTPDVHAYLWYLKAPSTGSNTIEVVFDRSCTDLSGGAISFTGVDQATPLDADNKASGSTGDYTVNVETVAANTYLVDVFASTQTTANNITIGANQIEIHLISMGSDCGGASYEAGGAAGTYTMSWVDEDADEYWAIVAASFKPAAAAGRVIKTLNGLAWASVKTINGVANASIKTYNGATAN